MDAAGFAIRRPLASPERFVLCLWPTFRVVINERREIVRTESVPDDVVLGRSVKFDKLQFRPHPLHAVAAFGVTDDFGVRRFAILDLQTAVIHAVQVAVLKDREVETTTSFPRFVGHQNDFPRNGFLNDQRGTATQPFDEIVISEQFPPRTDVDRLGGSSAKCHEKSEGGKNYRSHTVLFCQSISRGLYCRGP